MTTTVLIVDIHAEIYRDRLRAEFPALQFVLAPGAAEVKEDLADVEVLICFGIAVRDDILAAAPQLKWIQSLATGVDHFLVCPSLRPDVVITSGRGIHGPPMREQVVYLMMAASREAERQIKDKQAHFWERRLWSTLYGKTAVIVGIGVVGVAIGELLKALGMRVVGVTREPRKIDTFDAMIPTERLADAAREADYLINVLPASENNIGIFDANVFSAMKSSAYYINAGRGQTATKRRCWPRYASAALPAPVSTCSRPHRCRPTARSGTCRTYSSRRTSAATSSNMRSSSCR